MTVICSLGHVVILILSFSFILLLLGANSHGGPAVGAVGTGPQPPLQAGRVEDVPAAQLDEPVARATAPLEAYGALSWRRSSRGFTVFCFLAGCCFLQLRVRFGKHCDGHTLICVSDDGAFFNLARCDGFTGLEAIG